jgi:large subunit ribosomal protein L15
MHRRATVNSILFRKSGILNMFDEGAAINVHVLVGVGLVASVKSRVKVLGDGELTKKLDITAHKFSKSAEQKISGCGGTAKVVA